MIETAQNMGLDVRVKKYLMVKRDQKPNVEIRFIRGRLKFGDGKNSAPFPSMVVIFKSKKDGT